MANIAGIDSIDVLAQDEILIEFNQKLKNDDQARLVNNYSVVPVGSGTPVQINAVLLEDDIPIGSGVGSNSVILVISQFTSGEQYEVSIGEGLNWLSKDTLNSAKKTRRFIGRETKIDSVVGSRPAFYEIKPTAIFRNILNAIHREDDLIGGSQSEFISLNDDLMMGDEALFTKLKTYIVGADTNQFDIPDAVDGEALKEIMIKFWINNVAGVLVDFKAYPNGIKGVGTTAIFNQTGVADGNKTRANLCFTCGTTREQLSGLFKLQTILQPSGTSFNFNRRYEGNATVYDEPLTVGSTGFHKFHGGWSHGDGALTSLSFVCTTDNTDVLETGIGAGSIFELWKLQE